MLRWAVGKNSCLNGLKEKFMLKWAEGKNSSLKKERKRTSSDKAYIFPS